MKNEKVSFFSLVWGEKHKEKNDKKPNERKEKLNMYGMFLLGLSGMTKMFAAPFHWWNLASCTNRQRKANTKHQELNFADFLYVCSYSAGLCLLTQLERAESEFMRF
jgi:hypothetical protein